MECTCERCVRMCQRPCWPSPQEVREYMARGLGPRLMKDFWIRMGGDLYLICPAVPGYEGKNAPESNSFDGPCIFLHDGLCEIHSMKPYEGRLADCSKQQPTLHKDTAMLWDTPEGRTIVQKWAEKFLKED